MARGTAARARRADRCVPAVKHSVCGRHTSHSVCSCRVVRVRPGAGGEITHMLFAHEKSRGRAVIILDTAAARLCSVENIHEVRFTRAIYTQSLYIRMGHATLAPNRHCSKHCSNTVLTLLDRASDKSHKSPPPPRPTRPARAVFESRTASWPKGRGGLPYC